MKDEKTLYVGVVGFSLQDFDEDEAKDILEDAFELIESEMVEEGLHDNITIVSGGTNLGIPKIAYEIAESFDYETVGVVPDEAQQYDMFEVDQLIFEGEVFGDESEKFLDMLDIMIKIGGGKQSQREFDMAEEKGITTIEYDLEAE